jgi:hypothetical protein
MNAIKTYLLSLIFLLSFISSTFAQSNSDDKESVRLEQELSEEDSILVNCYFTEKEYNRIHGIYQSTTASNSEYTYEDEIYKGEKNKKRGRDTFLSDIPVELVVDVVLNTLFFVAILWH